MPIGFCLLPKPIGALAQLGEHLLCKQGVNGSIPLSSTIFGPHGERSLWLLPADGAPSRVFCQGKNPGSATTSGLYG